MAGFTADPGTQQSEGVLPTLTSRLNTLAKRLGVTIFGISGYRTPAHSVAVGGFADDPHTQAKAEDIAVNSQERASAGIITESQLESVGLTRPFAGAQEVNHIQLLGSSQKKVNSARNTGRLVKSVPSYVPQSYRSWVANAASSTGLPTGVVAAQIDMESGFNKSATSPTGAQGIAQIEPGTWAGLGISGSPYTPSAALQGYEKDMSSLLTQYNGNIRNALAAYNAGSGNIAAGYGYADSILGRAGLSSSATSGGGSGTVTPLGSKSSRPGGTPSKGSPTSPLITDFASVESTPRTAPQGYIAGQDISFTSEDVSFFGSLSSTFKFWLNGYLPGISALDKTITGPESVITDATSFMDMIARILNPMNWLRAVEFLTGGILMLIGLKGLVPRRSVVGTGASSVTRTVGNVAAFTPVGRELRIAEGTRMGRREGQREAARMSARQSETRGARTASARERAQTERAARRDARKSVVDG